MEVTAGFAICLSLYGLHKVTRRYFPANVNCWFCNHDFKVDYEKRNEWICPNCDQYNGFTDDGNYNVDLAAKYTQKKHFCAQKRLSNKDNGLCTTCNLNQDLKVHQLRHFVPQNPESFDDEIQEYAAHLERTYRLCRHCEASLHQTLGQQDSWLKPKLLSWKLEKNRQSPLSASAAKPVSKKTTKFKYFANNFALFAFSFVCWICCIGSLDLRFELWRQVNGVLLTEEWLENSLATLWFCEFIPNVCTLGICVICHALSVRCGNSSFWSEPRFAPVKAVTLASWILLLLMTLLDEYLGAKASESTFLFVSSVGFLGVFNLIVFNILPQNQEEAHRQVMKTSKPNNYPTLGNFGEWQWNNEDVLSQDLVSTSTPFESFVGNSSSSLLETSTVIAGSPEVAPPPPSNFDISVLSIDKKKSFDTSSQASAFSLRKYEAVNNSGINFGSSQKGALIKPAKFRPAAGQSWVAGGYWTPPKQPLFSSGSDLRPLSRSSSQSSGFVSVASNFGAAAAKNDVFDRLSVFSEKLNTFSLGPISHQQPFYASSTPRHQSQDSESSLNISKTSHEFSPRAKSSPIVAEPSSPSVLDRKIRIDVSLYSVVLVASVAANLALSVYLAHVYFA